MAKPDENVSMMQLVSELLSDTRTLLRQELALARAELREEVGRLAAVLLMVAAAAGALGIGALWVLVAITRALAVMFGWPLGAVYGGVGAAIAAGGLVLLAVARHRVRELKILPQTRETLVGWTPGTGHRAQQRG